ncbi:MAG: aldehyde dehydrogenase [Gemmatimonadetes bacterium]|nr:aldehyde dehydrogenase [Gemmatimonadota bacterium]
MKLSRRSLVSRILEDRGESLVVTGLGAPTYDVFAAGDSNANFYLWGAMGAAAMVGLGLAMSRGDRRVLVVTGDGELLMGAGSLAVIGDQRPANLGILVLDNEAFGETGRQPGLTSRGLELGRMAEAAGFKATATIRSDGELESLSRLLFEEEGPVLVVAKVALAEDPVALPSRDGPYLTRRFREGLGIAIE